MKIHTEGPFRYAGTHIQNDPENKLRIFSIQDPVDLVRSPSQFNDDDEDMPQMFILVRKG